MFQRRLVFSILLSVVSIVVMTGTGNAAEPSVSPVDQIMGRYRSLLLRTNIRPKLDTLLRYADRISNAGTWPDINYADRSRAAWEPQKHLNRVRLMVLAVISPEYKPQDTQKLRRAIRLALDNWNTERYKCRNWWFNAIGVPRLMRDIVMLLGDNLKGERRKNCIQVIGQYNVKGTGANLMWSAELALHHGCLTDNREQISQAARRIWAEVKTGAREGIQRDGSFYQHGSRLQTFHYGKSYLDVVIKIGWQLRKTPWAIPAEKRTIISHYILNGPRWMGREAYTVPGTLDRAVSRKGSLHQDLRHLLVLWREVDPTHREDFDAFIAQQKEDGSPPGGYRHFILGDFTVYHRPAASVFLKTISSRTRFTESINSENRKGVPYLNCGDHYILRDGREYHELQPLWQWNYLPGLTMSAKNLKQVRKAFVGGLGNGQSGLTTMDYARSRRSARLSLRKTWFFHDDVIICLMSGGERTNIKGPVVSSLEQCRLRGPVITRTNGTKIRRIKPGNHNLVSVRWILHNKIGYVPLNMAAVQVFLGEREGTWHSINRMYGKKKIKAPILQILLDHGKNPTPQGWVIVLGATRQQLDAMIRKPVWKAHRNDDGCQSILFSDGLQMASFYKPGSTGAAPRGEVTVDQPCLAIWSKNRLWLADPTMKGRDVVVRWNQRTYSIDLPQGGRAEQVVPAATDKPPR